MNLHLIPFVVSQYLSLYVTSACALVQSFSLHRLALLLFLLPLFTVLQLIHWIFLLLDELLFSDYRKINIHKPLFITGLPRSATTFFHRTLARDAQFTTTSCWECIFAPSITQRKIIFFCLKLHKKCGRPLAGLSKVTKPEFIAKFDAVHKIRLDEAEEDYLMLMPLLSCFLLVLAFPESKKFWQLGFFNTKIHKQDKKVILLFYKALLQKHLYVHGKEKIILSKNPAFCSFIPELRHFFPDYRIITMRRDPVKAYKSQLSSIVPTLRFLATARHGRLFAEHFLDLFVHYAAIIENHLQTKQVVSIRMEELTDNLLAIVQHVYEVFDLQIQPNMIADISLKANKSRSYRSAHQYELDLFCLDELLIRKRLASFFTNQTVTPGSVTSHILTMPNCATCLEDQANNPVSMECP